MNTNVRTNVNQSRKMDDVRATTLSGINGIKEKHYYMTFDQFYEVIFGDNDVTMEDAETYIVMNNDGIQRNISFERVQEIHQNIINQLIIQGIYTFTIATFQDSENGVIRNILVDGQHRLFALLGLDDEQYHAIEIHLRLITVTGIEQAHQLIEEIGKSHPVAPIGSSTTRKMYNYLESLIKNAINQPKKTKQPHYGNYTAELLEIARSNKFFNNFESCEQFVRIITQLNKWLFDTRHVKATQTFMTCGDTKKLTTKTYATFDTLLSTITSDVTDPIKASSRVYFCLHLIVNYGFMEIAVHLVRQEKELKRNVVDTDIILLVNNHNNRKNPILFNFNSRIDKKTEKSVINNFFGEETTKQCLCCKEMLLHKAERTNWAIGHIKAHSRGGSNRANNLIPICHGCNLSCGTRNLDQYTIDTFNHCLF
jgi:hypothetical protein